MRAGDDDLRATGLAAHIDKIDLDALTLDQPFTLDLLARRAGSGVCRLRAGADAQGSVTPCADRCA